MAQTSSILPQSPAPHDQAAVAVAVDHLTHRYPAARRRRASHHNQTPLTGSTDRPALDNVCMAIRAGEIFGILGPNGGGKSTLFRILSTMLRPTSGQVTIFGYDVVRQPGQVRQQLGVVFQNPSLDGKLTARENLMHQGHLYGIHGPELDQRIAAVLSRMNLADRTDERVERFSGGMRRRVELAKALLHQPRLLLLDEPATGLDPGARRELWTHLEHLRDQGGVTIALTTHLMEEADGCDRLAILATGQLRAIDTPSNLKARIGGDVATIEADLPTGTSALVDLAGAIAQRYAPWQEGSEPRVVDGKIRLEHANGPAFVATLAGDFPGQIRAISVGRPTLEDVFMNLTGQALAQDETTDAGVPTH